MMPIAPSPSPSQSTTTAKSRPRDAPCSLASPGGLPFGSPRTRTQTNGQGSPFLSAFIGNPVSRPSSPTLASYWTVDARRPQPPGATLLLAAEIHPRCEPVQRRPATRSTAAPPASTSRKHAACSNGGPCRKPTHAPPAAGFSLAQIRPQFQSQHDVQYPCANIPACTSSLIPDHHAPNDPRRPAPQRNPPCPPNLLIPQGEPRLTDRTCSEGRSRPCCQRGCASPRASIALSGRPGQ